MTLQLGVLISGSGTNLQALIDAIGEKRLDAEIKLVVSNKKDAYGLTRAKEARIPVAVIEHRQFESRQAFDEELVKKLRAAHVDWIALAGFMRVLTPHFLDAFKQKVVNIHPSLLPAFPGVNAQKQAFDYGVKLAGCTTHFVDGGVDTGPIIAQRAVHVLATDTAETLKDRILEQEHDLFARTLQTIAEGRVQLVEKGDRIHVEVTPTQTENESQGETYGL